MFLSLVFFFFFFFFSSRRRHTRLQGDWSSDVCSSDLSIRWTGRWEPCRTPSATLAPGPAPSTKHFRMSVRTLRRRSCLSHQMDSTAFCPPSPPPKTKNDLHPSRPSLHPSPALLYTLLGARYP